jgi:hypothetical protein
MRGQGIGHSFARSADFHRFSFIEGLELLAV